MTLKKDEIDILIDFIEGLTDDELSVVKSSSLAETLKRSYGKHNLPNTQSAVSSSPTISWRYGLGGPLDDSSDWKSEPATPQCVHVWKQTSGIFKIYEDCTVCGCKKEDVT
jgi:hypothetical protein